MSGNSVFYKNETIVKLDGNYNYFRTILKELYNLVAYPFLKRQTQHL